jgi:hypothetical protein
MSLWIGIDCDSGDMMEVVRKTNGSRRWELAMVWEEAWTIVHRKE